MLSGSTLLRVFLLLVASAVLAGTIRHYLPHDGGTAAMVSTEPSNAMVKRPTPAIEPETVRMAEAAKLPPSQPAAAEPQAPPVAPSRSIAPTRSIAAAPAPLPYVPEPAPPPEPAPEPMPGPSAALEPQRTGRSEDAPPASPPIETPEPGNADLIDLNSGTLSELNGLKGGGTIGRAIIQKRPYGSIDELLSKRVLSRSVYQRIKDQVTVR